MKLKFLNPANLIRILFTILSYSNSPVTASSVIRFGSNAVIPPKDSTAFALNELGLSKFAVYSIDCNTELAQNKSAIDTNNNQDDFRYASIASNKQLMLLHRSVDSSCCKFYNTMAVSLDKSKSLFISKPPHDAFIIENLDDTETVKIFDCKALPKDEDQWCKKHMCDF